MQVAAFSSDCTKDNFATFCALGANEEKDSQIILPLGKQNNNIILEDFSAIPSSLIVGTTGSGKSSFVKTLILELMQKYSPSRVLLAIYDSRRVDYRYLNGNPFMLAPACSERSKAAGLIQWCLTEARSRMQNLSSIEEYPHIFLVLDDFGEMSPSNETFADLVQLFQIARRVKIHCWLITSTPSYNVLPTDLKANINHKIAFRVASKSISRIVLDDVGADTLNVPGEILVKLNSGITKCNAVFLDDSDIEELSEAIAEKYPANAPFSPVESSSSVEEDDSLMDSLYDQAVDAILDTHIASVSMLQRHFGIRYSRAARIIDELEEAGIVGPFDGSKPRTILITREQREECRKKVSEETVSGPKEKSACQDAPHVPVSHDQPCLLTQQEVTLRNGCSIRVTGEFIYIRFSSEEYTIPGERITELVFKKPGFLRNGILSIHLCVSDQPESQRTFDILFDSRDANVLKSFCKQLSADIKKAFIEQ